MTQTRWLVELLLPNGTFEVRPLVTERTGEQLSADIHASVADLLAWKPQEPASAAASPLTQQQQTAQPSRRLVLAHASNPAKALRIALDLKDMFPTMPLPWCEETRQRFDAYLVSASG